MNKALKKIKAVSPIIATIILIIITIVAGIIIYFYTIGFLAGGATNVKLLIKGGAVAPGGGATVFVTLIIKNDGNVPIQLLTLRVQSAAVGMFDTVVVATAMQNLGSPYGTPPNFTFLGTPILPAGQEITAQYKYTMPRPVAGAQTVIQIEGINAVTGQHVAFLVTLTITPS